MTRLFQLVILLGVLALSAKAQPVLQNTYGTSCTYDWQGTTSPNNGGWFGCVSGGTCSTQAINGPANLYVGWEDAWSCNQGYVHAFGGITELYQYYVANGYETSYPIGLQANDESDVTAYYFIYDGTGGSTLYSTFTVYPGWEEQDCDGFEDFSGAYNYAC